MNDAHHISKEECNPSTLFFFLFQKLKLFLLNSSAELCKIVIGKMVKSNVPDLRKSYQARELGRRLVSLPLIAFITDIYYNAIPM